jgi:hypothetical protein
MNLSVCTICNQIMCTDNAKEFCIEVPKTGQRLSFRVCVFCQQKAESNNMHICLSCKSVDWYPSGRFRRDGIDYHLRFQCYHCIADASPEGVAVGGARA